MKNEKPNLESLTIFSTCPQSVEAENEAYIHKVVEVARWSEQCGFKGILVYSDNRLVDPWLVSQIIVQSTKGLCPLVAVQPIYAHPYWIAKTVASFGHLYGRRIYLNMIAGGFQNDLVALNDMTPHDKRYDRLVEYTTIIKELLAGSSAVSYEKEFYKVDKLKLMPPLSQGLFPGILVSGSSEAGMAAAKAIGAIAVEYPKPAEEYMDHPRNDGIDHGIRVGIIAREEEGDAWTIARHRFPEDRKGQITHLLATKTSDSVWHQQLAQMAEQKEDSPYWLVPYQNYKTFCPYLVGSYQRVGEELGRYITTGCKTFILDIPPDEEELHHTSIAFQHALGQGVK